MIVILFGPPGAGKGTQAERLAARYSFEHLSSGDVLRAERKSGTELGKKVTGYMDSGALVPDEIIIEVIISRVLKSTGKAGVLLDGFPRTLPQAEQLDEALARAGKKVDLVLSILVPDELIVERITGRRVCPSTGKIYHVKHLPPKVEGICDETGEKLIQRTDDTEAVVRQRLTAYHQQTEPLEAYYRGQDSLVEVDGVQDIEVVAGLINGVVDRCLTKAGS
ncbi:MAG TPA: adenylate kinase [Phycisphaerae bacterium]|nr:adenylate kinase [Phycisphaerae bacterium]